MKAKNSEIILRAEIRKILSESYTEKDYKQKVNISDLYIEADNMSDAFYKSKNTLGPSSRSSKHPLSVTKLLDGTLLLLDGHHRIADKIKYLESDNIEDILNLTFDAIVHNENYESIEDFPDGEYWIPFIDLVESMKSLLLKKVAENINVPINIGDEILGGRFKNQKVKVKEIGKNDKGDITINKTKPLLKFRIPKKKKLDEHTSSHFFKLEPTGEKEVSKGTIGEKFRFSKGKEVLGFVALAHPKDFEEGDLVIYRLSIKDELQGKGYGKALMKEIIRYAKKNGFNRLLLGVVKNNTKAINLYKSFGFEKYYFEGEEVKTEFGMLKNL